MYSPTKMKNIPQELIESLKKFSFFDEKLFVETQKKNADTSIRLNSKKNNFLPTQLDNVSWCETGYYFNENIIFAADPYWHAGNYYVQEASSMFIEQGLKQCLNLLDDIKVLDLCASPGGKSTLISNLLSENSLLISNEINFSRLDALKENISKWGSASNWISNNAPKDFLGIENYFDCILIDAPCSGSGLFRKDADAILHWSCENVEMCAERQKKILDDIFPSLKNNGILIYSTCSFSEKENEDVVDYILENFEVESCEIFIKNEWGIKETKSKMHHGFGYRFMPENLKGEGFFMSVFKNKSKNSTQLKLQRNNKKEIKLTEEIKLFVDVSKVYFFEKSNNTFFINKHHVEDFFYLDTKLRLIKKGIFLGEIIKNKLIPHHELAMYDKLIFKNCIELNLENAICYLKKEPFNIPEKEKGWYLISYQNAILGWVKHLGSRINNYYPGNYRIFNKNI